MRKTVSCILTAVLILSLAACGGQAEQSVTASSGDPVDGIFSVFSTVDLDGDPVDQSVFDGYKVTMVNIWGTFCGPCIREMPDLGELNRRYSKQGFQVIGIVLDVTDQNMQGIPEKLTEAKTIVCDTNADYLHILPSTSLSDALLKEVQAIPLTIFVDENGCQLGKQYLGSQDYATWEKIICDLLEVEK